MRTHRTFWIHTHTQIQRHSQHVNCAYAMWAADASTNNKKKNNNNTEMVLLKV